MNTLGNSGISDYQSRTVTIEVTGVRQQSVNKFGSYQVRVPFSQMSQAMQSINRRGDKVASVQLMGEPLVSVGKQAESEEGTSSEENAPEAKKAAKRKRK